MTVKTKPKRYTKPKRLPAQYQWLPKMRALLAKPGGWIRFMKSNDAGGYCLVGARLAVNGTVESIDDAADQVRKALQLQNIRGQGHYMSVAIYNDASNRTQGQIIRRIDKAIVRLSR